MNDQYFELYKNSKEYNLWMMKKDKFLNIINGTTENDKDIVTIILNEYVDNDLAGFISFKIGNGKGVICFLFVKEEYRNKGIGTKLLERCIEYIQSRGIKDVRFGGKPGSYIFPGLPKNLNIEGFFKKNGFLIEDGPIDMYQDITNWSCDEEIFKRVEKENVKIQFSNEKVVDKLLAFSKDNFDSWYDYFKRAFEKEKYQKVFYASIEDEIVGISMLWFGDCNWDLLFENNVGGGGALGVLDKYREKGIGLALKAFGTQIIKDRGIKYVWIGWTYVPDFYKKLGFKVWREYYNARLDIK